MQRSVLPRLGLVLALTGSAACFVDSSGGNCVGQGVQVEPCVIPMKVGQTRTFNATVSSDPSGAVNWVRTAALDAGFDNSVTGNAISLIGTLGTAGVYKLRAESAADPSIFGETTITVSTNAYGFPPSPLQVNGTDEPLGYVGAVAAGGNRYYFAYGNPAGPRLPRALPTNFFVQQFDLARNQPLATAEDQFRLFGLGDPQGVDPNVAADCDGNGYWFDRADTNDPLELRRMSASGVQDSFVLTGFTQAGPLAVGCDGALYFFGTLGSLVEIFKIPEFGVDPVVFDTGFSFAQFFFQTITTDLEGRVLLGASDASKSPAIIRVFPDGGVDETFQVSSTGVGAIAVDGQGVVYAVEGGRKIVGFNSKGDRIQEISTYDYPCTAGCSADCGADVPFENIVSIAAGPEGKLRVIEDLDFDVAVPVECQLPLRVILLDP